MDQWSSPLPTRATTAARSLSPRAGWASRLASSLPRAPRPGAWTASAARVLRWRSLAAPTAMPSTRPCAIPVATASVDQRYRRPRRESQPAQCRRVRFDAVFRIRRATRRGRRATGSARRTGGHGIARRRGRWCGAALRFWAGARSSRPAWADRSRRTPGQPCRTIRPADGRTELRAPVPLGLAGAAERTPRVRRDLGRESGCGGRAPGRRRLPATRCTGDRYRGDPRLC